LTVSDELLNRRSKPSDGRVWAATSGYSATAGPGRPDPAPCGGSENCAADGTLPELRRGGELKIIAAILERPVIEKILTHLGLAPQRPPRGRAREAGHDCTA